MSVRRTIYHLYPRFMALHDLTDNIALPPPPPSEQENGTGVETSLQLPSLMRDTFMGMHADGVYVIGELDVLHFVLHGLECGNFADNEEIMVLWIGSSVSPQVLLDLFGVESPHVIDPSIVCRPFSL